MQIKTKGIINLFLFLALCFQLSLCCNAQYEVYKAKTVDNDELVEQEKQKKDTDEYIPPYFENENAYFSNNNLGSFIENKTKSFMARKKRNKLKQTEEENTQEVQNEEVVQNEEENQEYKPRQIDNEVVSDENKFQINADEISYDDTDGNVYAKGNVEIIAKAKDTTLRADEAILDKSSQTIKLFKNVKVIKSGVEMAGESLVVDLNEQNVLMDNPVVNAYSFDISAQEGYIIANDIQMINGTIKSNRQTDIALETRAFQTYENVATDYMRRRRIDRSDTNRTIKQTYKVNAKEIILTSFKDHNSLVMKKANVYYNNHRILFNSDLEIISDKDKQYVEMSMLEAGSMRNFGTYVGYGYIAKLPKGQTLKIMPALTYGSGNFGVGIIGRHRSANSRLEAGWNTSTSNLIVKGNYRFTNHLNLRYGRNTYMSEGFMGARKSGYAAQLEYMNSYNVEGIPDLIYRQGIYAGIFSDYQKHRQEHAYATTRFRYMGELRKKIFEYQNKEQDMGIRLSAIAQGAATVYGSGETHGIVRIGPYITTKLKFWESSIGYAISGLHGDSPFNFDKYRYGKHTVMVSEQVHFGDKFALGYRANFTPMKDNIDHKLITESRFYAIFGPEDLKLVVSYDFIRSMAHMEFMFLLGTDSTRINFEKLITKNMDGGNRKRDFYKYAKPVKIVDPENI